MSLYVDKIAIMNVIGGIFKNGDFLSNEEYVFAEEDFHEQVPKIIYGALNNLYLDGIRKFDLVILDNYLSKVEGVYTIFQNKGVDYLKHCLDVSMLENFHYYFERMKKFTLLRTMDNYGINMKWFYNPTIPIMQAKEYEVQEDRLNNTSLVDIGSQIDKYIDDIKIKCVTSDDKIGMQAGDGLDELLKRLKETPEIGIPMYGAFVNKVVKGARLSKLYLRSAATGVGKAIPNDTLIPTPQGMRLVGDIKQGDFIFGQDGKPTKVLQVHPQKEQKEIWEIIFADGRKAKSCSEHLWEYRYDSHRTKEYRVEDIQTIYNRTLKLKNGLKNADNRGYRFHIRMNEPVEYRKKDFGVDPYVRGMALGGGSFRYDKTNKAFVFSSEDEDMVQTMADLLQADFKKNSDFNFGYVFKPKYNTKQNLWVEEIFKEYPKLWNVKSEGKFIPEEYMQGSIEQRLSLLQGLLDTDGGIDDKGRVSFTTVSPQLRNQIILLVNSLGMTGSYGADKRKDKYTTGECYNIKIQAKKSVKPLMFRLKRKVDIATKYASSSKREEYKDHLAIVDIKPTEEKTDMTCFTVDNKDSLFLMNDYIVTHNTRTLIADSCMFACNEIFNRKTMKWEQNGTKEPTLYITTEQEIDEIQTMLAAFVADVDEEKILEGTASFEELARVARAVEIIKESPLYIVSCPNFSLQDIENIIKINIKKYDVKYVCYDYIHTSMKILEEITRRSGGVKLREDNILFMLAVALKDLCNKYQIFILSSTQLNGSWYEATEVNQNLLRGAKSLADKVDIGCIIMPVRDFELDQIKPICDKLHYAVPTVAVHYYKNRRSKYKDVILWCKNNLGSCRLDPMFMTDTRYQYIEVEDMVIKVKE